jgi:hypothetical protein
MPDLKAIELHLKNLHIQYPNMRRTIVTLRTLNKQLDYYNTRFNTNNDTEYLYNDYKGILSQVKVILDSFENTKEIALLKIAYQDDTNQLQLLHTENYTNADGTKPFRFKIFKGYGQYVIKTYDLIENGSKEIQRDIFYNKLNQPLTEVIASSKSGLKIIS